MCGIAGYIGHNPLNGERIAGTLKLMRNRGPDHQAFRDFTDGRNHVHLLHSRLSIIDLDPRSHQPFGIDGCDLVFNGEIYNYIELRKSLEARGVKFQTQSDTEVLLQSYLQYGESCVDAFEGMWAFAIHDRNKKKLFLSRDRFAEKPLYWTKTGDGFYFGSEIKFLRNLSGGKFSVNEDHILSLLVNGYKSLYKTSRQFFKEVEELPFATSMTVDSDLRISSRRYWQPKSRIKEMTFEEAVEGFREHLFESLRIRLRSDVPASFCLSGGIDSSALVSIAAKKFGVKPHTFSIIDRDLRYDERDNINATVQDVGCQATMIHVSHDDSLEKLKRLIAYHDSPVGTITFFAHSFLTEAAAREGYKVIFAGHGADELVTGYYDHFNLHLFEMRDRKKYARLKRDWSKHIAPIVRNPHLKDPDLYFKDPSFRGHIYLDKEAFAGVMRKPFQEEFREEIYCESLLRNRMMNEMFHEGVRFILHEDDLNAMMVSIENRCPYLDSRLFDFSNSIPAEHLIKNGYGKWILREAVKGILNDKVRLDRQKKGFNASVQSLFDLKERHTREYLLDPSARIFDWVDREKMEKILLQDSFSDSFNKFVFSFISCRIFLELYG